MPSISMWGGASGTSPLSMDVMCISGFWIRPTLFLSDDAWRDLEVRKDVPTGIVWERDTVASWGRCVGSVESVVPRTWERRKMNVDPNRVGHIVSSSFATRNSRESNSQPHFITRLVISADMGFKSSSFRKVTDSKFCGIVGWASGVASRMYSIKHVEGISLNFTNPWSSEEFPY